MINQNILNKEFLFEDEEWIVEEVLTYGYKCSCRNLNTDEKTLFRTEYVEEKIKSYEDDLKAREKRWNAYHFEEEDEKILLHKIVASFCQKDLSSMSLDDLIALKKIKKEMNLD